MRSPTRSIVIVGGGFCGTVLAVNLLRRPPPGQTRILLVEQGDEIGRGLAYQVGPDQHLLNVPAGRMSADSADPNQFVRFAQGRKSGVAAGDFLPRPLYGEYLQDLLKSAERDAPQRVELETIRGRVCGIHRIGGAGSFLVYVADHGSLRADNVVLASGDPPPVCPSFARKVQHHPGYTDDPYRAGTLRGGERTLVVIGSGLTAADTIITAASLRPGTTIHAISRHGLLPAIQRDSTFNGDDLDISSILEQAAPLTARRLLEGLRSLAQTAKVLGGDWRDAMTTARYAAPRLWQQLPLIERRRFLRHARTYWDVHRHRLPPVTAARLGTLRALNQLHFHAGRILEVENEGQSLRVRWRPRGTETNSLLLADRVANCTGADRRLEHSHDPLLRSLLSAGLAVADPLGIGLRTGRHGALLGREGRDCGSGLYYLGPMLRAQHWEATAAGELRVHAEQLAHCLASEPEAATAASQPYGAEPEAARDGAQGGIAPPCSTPV